MTENTPTTKPTWVAEPVRSARHRVDGDGRTGLVFGAALVAMTLVAGLIYTFSAAIMPNLADADDRTFVTTMQRFNENPVFFLSFTVALVLIVLAVVLHRRHGAGVAVRWTVAALVLYGIVFAITVGLHEPLNNEIDQADPDRVAEVVDVRDDVEVPWVVGNIVRTLLATAAVAALARALFLHGRSTAGQKPGASAAEASWAPPVTTVPAGSSPSAEPSPPGRSFR
ncbi:MAG: anthrone oxygenase family protein [Acidimicrobiia bacterium]